MLSLSRLWATGPVASDISPSLLFDQRMAAPLQSHPLLATLIIGTEFASWVGTQSVVRLIRAMRVSISLVGLLLCLTAWALVSLAFAMRWWSQSYGPVPPVALWMHATLCAYFGVDLILRKDRGLGHLLDASLWLGWTAASVIVAVGDYQG